MSFDFPNAPTVGQAYSSYVWDGEKWVGGAQGSTVYVSDSAPAAPVGALWFESDTGILYVHYNDGNSTQWVAVVTPGVDAGAVRFDGAQTLTATQQTQARKNVYAAPFDAMAYSGMQINGSFDVSQEVGTTGVSLNGKYACDGWSLVKNGTMTVTAQQAAGGSVAGFANFLGVIVGVTEPTLAAVDFTLLVQGIEGYRTSRLAWGGGNAQPITLAFWSQHDVTGLYTGIVRNSVPNRHYAFSYTQAVASVAQYNVVTIPGCTDGAWLVDNNTGVSIIFSMGCGATYTTPSLNAWISGGGPYFSGPGQVNMMVTSSNWFRLYGVTVLPGIEAPSAARSPLIMRPYDQELLTCQRYYQKSYNYSSALGTATQIGAVGMAAMVLSAVQIGGQGTGFRFPVRMRSNPSIVTWDMPGTSGKVSLNTIQTGALVSATPSLGNIGETGVQAVAITSLAGLTAGQAAEILLHYSADARL